MSTFDSPSAGLSIAGKSSMSSGNFQNAEASSSRPVPSHPGSARSSSQGSRASVRRPLALPVNVDTTGAMIMAAPSPDTQSAARQADEDHAADHAAMPNLGVQTERLGNGLAQGAGGEKSVESSTQTREKDGIEIYLPNHTESVSHIALDVSQSAVAGSSMNIVCMSRAVGRVISLSCSASDARRSVDRWPRWFTSLILARPFPTRAKGPRPHHPVQTRPVASLRPSPRRAPDSSASIASRACTRLARHPRNHIRIRLLIRRMGRKRFLLVH